MPKNSQSEDSSKNLSTPFAVVILVGITAIICVGLYWLYLDFIDDQNALAAETGSLYLTRSGVQGAKTYTDPEAYFKLTLSSDWVVKDSYHYQTAGGEKAIVPTLILARRADLKDDSGLNQISVNLRQASCVFIDGATEETEQLGEVTVKTLRLNSPKQDPTTVWCSEAEVKGLDINQNNAYYHFVSYHEDIEVQKAFKEIVQSFDVVL